MDLEDVVSWGPGDAMPMISIWVREEGWEKQRGMEARFVLSWMTFFPWGLFPVKGPRHGEK